MRLLAGDRRSRDRTAAIRRRCRTPTAIAASSFNHLARMRCARLAPRIRSPFRRTRAMQAPSGSPVQAPHSHSMIFGHDNALISHRKFCRACSRTDSSIRQKFALLNPKDNFRDLEFARFQRLSASIGQFFDISSENGVIGLAEKRPSARRQQSGPRTRQRPIQLIYSQPKQSCVQPPPIIQSYPATCPRAPTARWRVAARFPAAAAVS